MNTASNAFRISSHDFDHGAKEVVKAFQCCWGKNHNSTNESEEEENQSTNHSFDEYSYLHQWELRESFGMTYMIHPPIVMASYTSNSGDQCGRKDPTTHLQTEKGSCEEEYEYQYDDIEDWIDDSVHIPAGTYNGSETNAPTYCKPDTETSSEREWGNQNNIHRQYIEWKFSAVYSHVWGVPVLYFEVHTTDGQSLLRDELLLHLNRLSSSPSPSPSRHSTNSSPMSTTQITTTNSVEHQEESCYDGDGIGNEEDWTFVSHEEHPITGIPSYFLHPCQTSKRLHLVFDNNVAASHADKTTIKNMSEDESRSDVKPTSTSKPQSEPTIRNKERRDDPGCVILTWLSMILPAAGFRISTNVFQQIDSKLLCNKK